jgi:hypothetical protein
MAEWNKFIGDAIRMTRKRKRPGKWKQGRHEMSACIYNYWFLF